MASLSFMLVHLYFVNVYFKAFVSEPKSVGLPSLSLDALIVL